MSEPMPPDQTSVPSSRDLALLVARAADSKKADAVTIMDVGPIIGICDYFVICSASNSRLVAAVAQEIEDQVAIEYDRRVRSGRRVVPAGFRIRSLSPSGTGDRNLRETARLE
jgi:hypothetical protein